MGRQIAESLLFVGLAVCLAGTATAQPAQPLPRHTQSVPLDAPALKITNGLITAKIYPPDSEKGFYRGTRFDQSGVIGSLAIEGRNFYGPWFDRVSPEVADYVFTPDGIVGGPDSSIAGPVEEFAPIGFDEAQPGGTFMKIGVGLLRKPDAKPYDHYRLYDIADAGLRSVLTAKDSVTFTEDVARGFRYVKTLRLVPGKPQLQIEHVLTNKSGKPISTDVYDHNFLVLKPGNQGLVATFPFPITPDNPPDAGVVRMEAKRFTYLQPLTGNQVVSFHLAGFGRDRRDYDISVDDTNTGAGVRIVGDQPLSQLNVWSIRSVMAVDPYIAIELAPGATKRWSYTYTYKAK